MREATQKELDERKLNEIRDEMATDWCIEMGVYNKEHFAFQAGFDNGAKVMAKIKDEEWEKRVGILVGALENIVSEYSEDIYDEGYNPHLNPAFTIANEALEKFRKEVG